MSILAKRLVFAQGMDVLTFCMFFILVNQSVHVERNPLIAAIYTLGGFGLVGIVKMGYVTFVARRAKNFAPSKKLIIAMSVATASGIAGAGFNLASLLNSFGVSI